LVDIALRNVGDDGLVLVRKGLTVTQLFLCISYFILQCFPGFWGLLQKDRVNTKHIYIINVNTKHIKKEHQHKNLTQKKKSLERERE
jgi:hypothetical protein